MSYCVGRKHGGACTLQGRGLGQVSAPSASVRHQGRPAMGSRNSAEPAQMCQASGQHASVLGTVVAGHLSTFEEVLGKMLGPWVEPCCTFQCSLLVRCRWAGGSGAACKLFTASYDGSLRMLDPQAGRFELLITDEDAEYSAMDCMSGRCPTVSSRWGPCQLHVYGSPQYAGLVCLHGGGGEETGPAVGGGWLC